MSVFTEFNAEDLGILVATHIVSGAMWVAAVLLFNAVAAVLGRRGHSESKVVGHPVAVLTPNVPS